MRSVLALFSIFYTVFYWLLILRIIVSFVQVDPYSPMVKLLYKATEPFLAPVRRAFGLIQVGGVSLDVSPIIVLILLNIVRNLLYYI